MKLFVCQACGNVLYFENRACERCGHRVAFLPEKEMMSAIEPDGEVWKTLADEGASRMLCRNAAFDACNWLTEAGDTTGYCRACRHNGIVPDLSDPAQLAGWRELEVAKHRLFYSLIHWKLPLQTRQDNPEHGLIFNFLADDPNGGQRIMTGHDNGLITIALTEADDIERERRRLEMGEPYRTLLGHFRHEVGHYFWDVLVSEGGRLEECRAVFGDDSADYGQALRLHYAEGAPPDWHQNYVSAYATTHPWEDFAETWAHYLHIVDTLEMASEFGMEVRPKVDRDGELSTRIRFNPHEARDVEALVNAWLPFTFAMNSVNRAMGLRDLYPFILSPAVVAKLGFIHGLVRDAAKAESKSKATFKAETKAQSEVRGQ
ncbi:MULTISPECIES: putative zinc-binding peptidase [unclassified Bradyrhizobium]|uniref:zinc-binding metallopeptidase family protein n=1 Tax=unclassified Bradyrhizobium TaxID=2631580 RepID=UPI001FFAA6A5|nr:MULTISPECIES: putative zinc-binding peptidase [unclassified Bradyrhizobium]MCK1711299.1 putative zinc-binding peptidase [Bradyrhizobium sp. 143]MCK1723908.1 putative zinc-binding peptidase [Bradyrhizobium sp. 142]